MAVSIEMSVFVDCLTELSFSFVSLVLPYSPFAISHISGRRIETSTVRAVGNSIQNVELKLRAK